MHRCWWMACTLGAAMLVGGCEREVKREEAQLGHVPISDKQAIFTAQHNVEVEDANLVAAKRATDEARLFHDVADHELDAAKNRVIAAERAIKLEGRSGGASGIRDAQAFYDVAAKEQIAAKAKVDYADRLIDLRKNEESLVEARRDDAKAHLQVVAAQTVERNGMRSGTDVGKLEREQLDTRTKVMERERKVATMRDDASRARSTWEERRHTFNLAQRSAPAMAPTPTPQPPPQIQPVPPPAEPDSHR